MLVLVGLLLSAAIYPAVGGLIDPAHSDTGDLIGSAVLVVIGIALIVLAPGKSSEQRVAAAAA